MSGSNTTQSGEAVTALPVASAVEQDDVMLGIVGGAMVQVPVSVATSGAITASSGGTLAAPILTGSGYVPATVSSGGSVVTDPSQLARMADVTSAVTSATAPLTGAVTSAQTFASQAEASNQSAAGQAVAAGQSAGQSGVSAVAAQTAQTGAETARDSAQNIVSASSGVLAQISARVVAGRNGIVPSDAAWAGGWNAATNTPALSSGQSGGQGAPVYLVTTAGTTTLDGTSEWNAGDAAAFVNGAWVRLVNAGVTIATVFTALKNIVAGGHSFGAGGGNNLFSIETLDSLGMLVLDADANLAIAGDTITTASMTQGLADIPGWLEVVQSFDGGVLRGLLSDGSPVFTGSQAVFGPATIAAASGGIATGLTISDAIGNVLFDTTGAYGSGPEVVGYPAFTEEEIAAFDADNLAYSASVMAGPGDILRARPVWGMSLSLSTGQSEMDGWMSLPALSVVPNVSYGNIMFGQSTRCADPNPTSSPWQPVGGDAAPQPLVATQFNYSTNELMTRPGIQLVSYTPASVTVTVDPENAQEITIATTDSTVDFTVGQWAAGHAQSVACPGFQVGDVLQMTGFTGAAAVNNLQALEYGLTQGYTITAVSAQSITATLNALGNSGATNPVAASNVTGITIAILWADLLPYLGEQQSVSALNLFRKAQLKARGLASDPSRILANASSCVGGQSIAALSSGANPDIYQRNPQAVQILMQQAGIAKVTAGVFCVEFCQGGSDGTTPYAQYLASLIAFRAQINSDILSITGQQDIPFFEIVQISGGNVPYYGNFDVVRAQHDFAMSTPGVYIAGIGANAQDFYAHYTANGERYVGALRAKVRHRVITQGLGWEHMHIRSAVARGVVVIINLHVPVPPVQALPTWVGNEQYLAADLGFCGFDAFGNQIAVVSAQIVGEATVRLIMATPPARIRYGYSNGSGNVYDSDSTLSEDEYVYVPGDGAPLVNDLPALVGQPMALQNPLCLYDLPVTQG